MRGDSASLNFPNTDYMEDAFMKKYGHLPKQSYILKLRQWAQARMVQSIEGSGDDAGHPGGSSDSPAAEQEAALPRSISSHRRSSQALPELSQPQGQAAGARKEVQQEMAATRRSSRMARRQLQMGAGRSFEQPPRPPTYFGSVALAAHPFPTVSTMALHFGAPGQSMLRPEHLLASHQLPEFLEQEDRAWHSSHGLASLSSGWGREEAANWPVFPGSPLVSIPNPAQQAAQSGMTSAAPQHAARFAPVESMLSRVMARPGSSRSAPVQRTPLDAGPSQGLQGSGSEGQQRRGGTAPVNLPHLPLGFPDLHLHLMQQDADEGILVDQPRVFTSAAQMLSDILPSTLITIGAPPPGDGQPPQPRPRSALPSAPDTSMQHSHHRTSVSAPAQRHPAPGITRQSQRAGNVHAWECLQPESDTQQAERRARPMGRSHSFPAHLQAQLAPSAGSIYGLQLLPSAAMLRTASHSQALGGGAGLHAHPERSEGEPDLAPVVEGEGVDREGGGEAAPDQAASQEEQLLISGGSAHLGTGIGLVASVTQEHSSWADANPEPAPQQVAAAAEPDGET
ncbi:hypothetical protein COCSUDRAFT_48417 [Coccomyxa subellipsoidea C-169]|uniref:Uncharacterized protein n=1 Tax=Coccomyxa subellipsoidea (strain C-169) TaxID=574566 RepID=I0YQZ1_COCSC|nr:hypothetical protein COCSUDRAFT_48417 [Coccomyxa subellipsoidea C-169]EIE20810.1 hypothetical protein COCSUDRAFT_48417 [Coccomyxa subellipsoidea C-169]|eukprot:XP_005645354.1 hypothetical protein COCSUDRAFT_48417 [Coccomyxa subellipsoidea C-169]